MVWVVACFTQSDRHKKVARRGGRAAGKGRRAARARARAGACALGPALRSAHSRSRHLQHACAGDPQGARRRQQRAGVRARWSPPATWRPAEASDAGRAGTLKRTLRRCRRPLCIPSESAAPRARIPCVRRAVRPRGGRARGALPRRARAGAQRSKGPAGDAIVLAVNECVQNATGPLLVRRMCRCPRGPPLLLSKRVRARGVPVHLDAPARCTAWICWAVRSRLYK